MGSTLKGKKNAPSPLGRFGTPWSSFFLLEKTSFQRGLGAQERKQEIIVDVSIVKKNSGTVSRVVTRHNLTFTKEKSCNKRNLLFEGIGYTW